MELNDILAAATIAAFFYGIYRTNKAGDKLLADEVSKKSLRDINKIIMTAERSK